MTWLAQNASALLVGTIAAIGAGYTAYQARKGQDRTADISGFEKLTAGLHAELGRMKDDIAETRTELRETRVDLRSCMDYLRVTLTELDRHEIPRPTVPPTIQTFPWED